MQNDKPIIHNEKSIDPGSSLSVSPKKQWPIVVGVLLIAFFIAFLLTAFKPRAEKKVVKSESPVAEYIVAKLTSLAVPVVSQGSVKAKTEIKLVAQVSGRITHMAKLKHNGGFFKKDELLLSIDDTDYRLAMTRAQAQVAAAKQQLIKVEIEAGQAKYDLQQIGRDPSKSTAYALRQPQLAEAQASLQAAQADLELSHLQMQRTKVVAPFNGRVVSKQVDIGQYVSEGTLLADIYSTEMVTVRLPLSLSQTELLGIKLRGNQDLFETLTIKLLSEYAAKKYQWDAQFSHTEGEIDVRNRLVYLVAQVQDPYVKQDAFLERPPLTPGMFVKAQLSGLEKPMFKMPRSALRYNSTIWLIDPQNKLQIKPVNVLTKDRDFIYVDSGLKQGDRVINSSIDYPLNGMLLTPVLISETKINNQTILKAANE